MKASISSVMRAVETVLVKFEEKPSLDTASYISQIVKVEGTREDEGPDEGNRLERKFIKLNVEVEE